ncbi:MAG: tRNA(Ile)(2)-agmatinylcytidine synthase [Thermoplasmata archaeon]
MVLHVGIDDTDSMERMCTTYVATEIVSRFRGLDLIGYPRLVRLNPNIPWKTRGNGALCLRYGVGQGTPFHVGRIGGERVEAYPRSGPVETNEDLWETCEDVVMELADLEDPEAQPGLVVTRRPPSPGLYWRAVTDVVSWKEVEPLLSLVDFYLAPKGMRGLIGSLAAISWRPRDRTYEVLAYRMRERWGSLRVVREEDVMALDERFPTTFNNYDHDNRHMAVVPNSPCPVLLGIRGDVADDLPRALSTIKCEAVDRWILFKTNQGTDEHLVRRRVQDLRSNISAIVEGTVSARPRILEGGHVVFPLDDGSSVDCVAYEPTKAFREIVRELYPGDSVRVYGSVRDIPRSLNLEKLDVIELRPIVVKVANPRCPSCCRSMKSVGRVGGFRCRLCGAKAPSDAAEFRPLDRRITEGIFEPPVAARRHLSRPVKRMALPRQGEGSRTLRTLLIRP